MNGRQYDGTTQHKGHWLHRHQQRHYEMPRSHTRSREVRLGHTIPQLKTRGMSELTAGGGSVCCRSLLTLLSVVLIGQQCGEISVGARVGSGDIRSRQWWCRVGWRVQTARGARPPPPRSRAGAQLHLPPTLPRPHPHVLPHLSLLILLHPLPPHTYLPPLILDSQTSSTLPSHSHFLCLLSPSFRSHFSQTKVRICSYSKTLPR